METVPRPCSAAAALSVVGEKWSLLALRELFYGVRRFSRIVANTGAPRDVLTARLRHLEEAGVVRREQYSDRPPRYEYHLTPAGEELLPVLLELVRWGDRWVVERPAIAFEHTCGHDLEPVYACRACGGEVHGPDLAPRALRGRRAGAAPLPNRLGV